MSDVYFSPDHEKYVSYCTCTCLQSTDKDFFFNKMVFWQILYLLHFTITGLYG